MNEILPEKIEIEHKVHGEGSYHVPVSLSRSHKQILHVLARSRIPLKAKWLRTLVNLKTGTIAGRLSELLKMKLIEIADRKERPFSYTITELGLQALKTANKKKASKILEVRS